MKKNEKKFGKVKKSPDLCIGLGKVTQLNNFQTNKISNNMTAVELLAAYAAGEREFGYADLFGANLSGAELSGAIGI